MRIAFLPALFSLFFFHAYTATADAQPVRVLKSLKLETKEDAINILLNIGENNGRKLGRVYYSATRIKIIITKTEMGLRQHLIVKADDELLSSVEAQAHGGDVVVTINLLKPIVSLLEHISFNHLADSSLITIKRPGSFGKTAGIPAELVEAKTAAEESSVKTGKAESPPVVAPPLEKGVFEQAPEAGAPELLPLVVPEEVNEIIREAPGESAVSGKLNERNARKRGKMLDELFGKKKAKVGASAETTGVSKPDDAEKTRILKGEETDLTVLYLTIGMILIVAAAWFFVRRGRIITLAQIGGSLDIVQTLKIGGKQKLMVVDSEGKRLLLSSNGKKNIKLIAELDPGKPINSQIESIREERKRANMPEPKGIGGSGESEYLNRPSYFGDENEPEQGLGWNSEISPDDNSEEGLRQRLRALRWRNG